MDTKAIGSYFRALAPYLSAGTDESSLGLRRRFGSKERYIALMMKAVSTSETSVNFYQNPQPNSSEEDSLLHTFPREDLKSVFFLFSRQNICC
jgi:hypothetical protein